MQEIVGKVMTAMLEYNYGCPELINHALKVHGFAAGIGAMEKLDDHTQTVLEITALLHDIGIRPSEEIYHSYAGKHQQVEGPPVAGEILANLEVDEGTIERVCYLIAHHHEYDHMDGMDYQILVEADFLVNLYEEGLNDERVQKAKETIFRTKAGLHFLENLYEKTPPTPSLFAAELRRRLCKTL